MHKLIFFITFFVYSGYYAVLALLMAIGLGNNSRLITFPLRLVTTFLMLYAIGKMLKTKNRFEERKLFYYILFLIFWILYFLKILFHQNSIAPLMRSWYEYMFYAINFCILPFFTFSLLDFYKYRRTIIKALLSSGLVMALISIFLYKEAIFMQVGRLNMLEYETGEATISPISLSYVGSITFALCIYELFYNNCKSLSYKLYIYIVLLLSSVLFLVGASRSSVIALFLSLLVLFLYSSVKNKIKIFTYAIISIPVFIFLLEYTGSSIFERSSSTANNGDSGGRFELWNAALDNFYLNPIFGNYIELVNAPGYSNIGVGNMYPHNMFVEVLMSTGVVGFFIFVICFLEGLRQGLRFVQKDRYFVWVFALLIQGLSLQFFSGSIYTAILFFFPLGLTFGTLKKN